MADYKKWVEKCSFEIIEIFSQEKHKKIDFCS